MNPITFLGEFLLRIMGGERGIAGQIVFEDHFDSICVFGAGVSCFLFSFSSRVRFAVDGPMHTPTPISDLDLVLMFTQ